MYARLHICVGRTVVAVNGIRVSSRSLATKVREGLGSESSCDRGGHFWGHSAESAYYPNILTAPTLLCFFGSCSRHVRGAVRLLSFHEQSVSTPKRGSLVATKGVPPIVGRYWARHALCFVPISLLLSRVRVRGVSYLAERVI